MRADLAVQPWFPLHEATHVAKPRRTGAEVVPTVPMVRHATDAVYSRQRRSVSSRRHGSGACSRRTERTQSVLVGGVIEEAARVAIDAQAIGGPVEIPAAMRAAALQRAMAFDAAGVLTA